MDKMLNKYVQYMVDQAISPDINRENDIGSTLSFVEMTSAKCVENLFLNDVAKDATKLRVRFKFYC